MKGKFLNFVLKHFRLEKQIFVSSRSHVLKMLQVENMSRAIKCFMDFSIYTGRKYGLLI